MAKVLKTFVINKAQIAALRALLIENGNVAEAEKFSGGDLALRWKAINLDGFPANKKEEFSKQYPYFVGFDLISIVPAPKEVSPAPEADATSGEMTAPAKAKKVKGEPAAETVAVNADNFADAESEA